MNKYILGLIIIIAAGIGIALALDRLYFTNDITTYEQCLDTPGSQVQASEPPICTTPDGRTFQAPPPTTQDVSSYEECLSAPGSTTISPHNDCQTQDGRRFPHPSITSTPPITSFEQCLETVGHQLTASEPPTCITADGHRFVKSDTVSPTQKALDGCSISGCSGEICADEIMVSPCVYKEEYACYRSATCERQADGNCGWTMTPDLKSCILDSRGGAQTDTEDSL